MMSRSSGNARLSRPDLSCESARSSTVSSRSSLAVALPARRAPVRAGCRRASTVPSPHGASQQFQGVIQAASPRRFPTGDPFHLEQNTSTASVPQGQPVAVLLPPTMTPRPDSNVSKVRRRLALGPYVRHRRARWASGASSSTRSSRVTSRPGSPRASRRQPAVWAYPGAACQRAGALKGRPGLNLHPSPCSNGYSADHAAKSTTLFGDALLTGRRGMAVGDLRITVRRVA